MVRSYCVGLCVVFVISSLLLSSTGVLLLSTPVGPGADPAAVIGDVGCRQAPEPGGSRGGLLESDACGGSWVDTFDDDTAIHSSDQVENLGGKYSIGYYEQGDGFEGASVDMDYWTQAGAGTNYVTGSKAHTGSQCLQIDDIPPGENRNGLSHQWTASHQGTVSLWAYDDLGATGLNFKLRSAGTISMGILMRQSYPGNYYVETSTSTYQNTFVARSLGWHKFEFRVDSSGTVAYIDGFKVTVFTGSATNFDYCRFNNAWDHSQSSWVDDFEAKWPHSYGVVNSTAVSLPEGESWDALHVGSYIPSQTAAAVTILDGVTRQPISGYTDLDISAGPEIDLSGLDRDSIALGIDLGTTGAVSPEILCWGVSSNSSNAWRDTLFGGTKLELLPDSFESLDGELKKVSDLGNDELVRSEAIVIPGGHEPKTLNINKEDFPSAKLLVTVLDGSTNQPIAGFTDLDSAEVNLSGIGVYSHPTLKLQARFDATTTFKPVLKDWSVEWDLIRAPKIDELPSVTVDEDTLVEHSLDLAQYTTSPLQDSRELDYELTGVSDDWLDAFVSEGHYIGVDATITPNANSDTHGTVTAMVTAVDDEGTSSFPAQLTIFIEPVNDEPFPDVGIPDIYMYEEGEDDSILLDSELYFRDIELDKIHYSARVDPLDEFDGEEGNLTASIDPVSNKLEIRSLGDFNTGDGPPVPLWVHADDDKDVNTVDSGYLEDGTTPNWTHQEVGVFVIDINDPPVWEPIPKVVMDEDEVRKDMLYLMDYVTDVDDEIFDLRFELSANTYDRIDVSITDDGWVSVEPDMNAWGQAQIEVEVTDGTDRVLNTFNIEVRPVNDLPSVDILAPAPDAVVKGEITVSGEASDVENTLEYVELFLAPTSYIGPRGGTRYISEPVTARAQGLGEWQYQWDTTALVNGEWRITARAFDGSAFSSNATVIVYIDNPRNQPPTVEITSHSRGGEVPAGVIMLGGGSADQDGAVELVQVSVGGNDSWVPALADAGTGAFDSWTYSMNVSTYAGTNVTVYVRAFDGTLYSGESAITLHVQEAPAGGGGTVGDGGGDGDGDSAERDSTGRNTSMQNIILILVVVIVAVIIALAMLVVTNRNRKRREEEEEAKKKGEGALQPEIIRPGEKGGRLRATPAEIVKEPRAPSLRSAGPAAAAAMPAPSGLTGPAAPGMTLGGAGTPPPDLLLPKAGDTAGAKVGGDPAAAPGRDAPFRQTRKIGALDARGSGPTAAPSVEITSRTVPVKPAPAPAEFEYKQPDAAPFTVSGSAPDKAEVYHQDSGAVWTPDMATSRTAKEAESAVEMLEKLNRLKESGAISQDEYERSKKRLLRKI